MSIASEIRKKWKPRPLASHKGNYGRLFILAGSRGYTGAAHLAAAAAVRSGAGLVTLGIPDSIYPVLARREAEVMVRPFPSTAGGTISFRAFKPVADFLKTQDVFAIGPGLSRNPETQKLIREILMRSKLPSVIDADGLNAFQNHQKDLKKCAAPAILTPHPGEFVRLFGGKLSDDDADRKRRARDATQRFNKIVVLKGYRTVVANPDGGIYSNSTGNPGMAKGGTGDVLTGIIAALLAQKFSLWDAARFGVYFHGLAGDMAAQKIGQISLSATDILDFLPQTFRKILHC